MGAQGIKLFDTAIGRCGIAWSERGVLAVQLPEPREADTRAKLLNRAPDAQAGTPPVDVERAIGAIVALLSGQASDLAAVTLDLERVSPFSQRVYQVARGIAPGETLSYGEVATRLGAPGSARAVGQALGRNPFPVIVPCHRVLAAGGKMGGFSAGGGVVTKLRLLSVEADQASGASTLLDATGVLAFDPVVAVEHLRAADSALAALIDAVGPCRLRAKATRSVFAALAEAIVYQQLNGRAAATIFARLCALFPRAHEGFAPGQILRASDAKLRSAGLSRAKLLALRDLAQRAADGKIPTFPTLRTMQDEAIIEQLCEVRGIGRWTAEMLLMFRLGRPDVLPVDDYGVRQGYALAFRKRHLPERAALEKHARRWRPYRSVASWYLWRAVDLAREQSKDID